MITRAILAGEAGTCMSTHGRRSLEQVGKVISFGLAWAIVMAQGWASVFHERKPDVMLMGLAVFIIAPAAIQYLLPGRGGSEPSEPPAPQASSSSAASSSEPASGGG